MRSNGPLHQVKGLTQCLKYIGSCTNQYGINECHMTGCETQTPKSVYSKSPPSVKNPLLDAQRANPLPTMNSRTGYSYVLPHGLLRLLNMHPSLI